MKSDVLNYWDAFYTGSNSKPPRHPSQFAAFVMGECSGATNLVEFGCGTGRDAAFFANYDLNVIALDASEGAIKFCRDLNLNTNIKFEKFILGEDDIGNIVKIDASEKTIFYARFFLHAITDDEEEKFFNILHALAPIGSMLALEYRCTGDEVITKEFGKHFRRFLSHSEVCARIASSGFDVVYQIDGKGFAKYKSEDALVG